MRVIHLHVPPLRERPEDMPALARHFLGAGRARVHSRDEACALPALPVAGERARAAERRRAAVWLHPRTSGSSIGRSRCAADRADSAARTAPAGGRRAVRCLVTARRLVLGARLPDVSDPRHHAPRPAQARSSRSARVSGPLQVDAQLFGMTRDYRRFMNFLAAHGAASGSGNSVELLPTSADSGESPLGSAAVEVPAGADSQFVDTGDSGRDHFLGGAVRQRVAAVPRSTNVREDGAPASWGISIGLDDLRVVFPGKPPGR